MSKQEHEMESRLQRLDSMFRDSKPMSLRTDHGAELNDDELLKVVQLEMKKAVKQERLILQWTLTLNSVNEILSYT